MNTEKPKCVYLSWGSALAEFKQSHGKFNIILGADVVFWPHAIPLLFQTAAFLLSDEVISNCVLLHQCCLRRSQCQSNSHFYVVISACKLHGYRLHYKSRQIYQADV